MIYFVRHGRTPHNEKNLFSGVNEINLTEEGLTQAKQTALLLQEVKLDYIFSSPLKRAMDTANEINKFHNLPITTNSAIKERNYGNFEQTLVTQNLMESLWNYNSEEIHQHCETIDQLLERVSIFLTYLKENHKNKNILIVAHNGVGRMIEVFFKGMPADGKLSTINFKNASVATFEFN